MKDLVDWVLGPEGQKLVLEVGYYPLKDSEATNEAEKSKFCERLALARNLAVELVLSDRNCLKWPAIADLVDRIAEKLIFAFALLAIAIIFLIFVYVAREAAPLAWSTVDGVSLRSPFSAPVTWQPVSEYPNSTCFPSSLGHSRSRLIAMLIATPLALGRRPVYTAEFAPPPLREWIKPAIELLAGIPSVVVGFLRPDCPRLVASGCASVSSSGSTHSPRGSALLLR